MLRRLVIAFTVPLVVSLVSAPQALADDSPVPDPIPEKPVASGLALTVDELVTMPKSDTNPPTTDKRLQRYARINYVGELPDGSGRMYVPDLNGKLYTVKNGAPREYLDVGAAAGADFFNNRGLGTGFGFVAFHPDFKQNGKFYTVHTENGNALLTKQADWAQPNTIEQSVVDEWTATDPAADTFTGTHREILRIGFAGTLHTIQEISFNPTARRGDDDYGKLYLAVGDGGRGVTNNDPQDLSIPHGKLIRIDPAGTNSANGKYGIPSTNPFVGRAGAIGEIYSYGYRDPHRFSWDPWTRKLYLGMIGEHAIEGVYDVKPGDNAGWSQREGPFVFRSSDRCFLYPLPANDADFGYTYPVAAYDHDRPPNLSCTADSGHAVIGGFVYRGRSIPALFGKYVFGDGVNGSLFYTETAEMSRVANGQRAPIHKLSVVDRSGRVLTMQDLAGDSRVDLKFGTDNAGDIFVLSKANGKIWQITGAVPRPDVVPTLAPNLVAQYDFDHPALGNPAMERDLGSSGTAVQLINGGAAMRVQDGSRSALQTQQVNPTVKGNDDWKAGTYSATGVPTLLAFNHTQQITVMGWVKPTGPNPSPNTNSTDPARFFGAVALMGVLSGDSDGHTVRALLELIEVDGVMKLVALGRRVDGGASQTFAATEDWHKILPDNKWTFLTATFDYDTGAMALYANGVPVPGAYVVQGDPWGVRTGDPPYFTSATNPRGIKIGGGFPQNTREDNPCNCRFDNVMFLDRVVRPWEVGAQYALTRAAF
ncbi:PQQ-dependent sugar dehydrogenase [Actinocrispum wychmicini]|uniref:Concanavalin A-like lectin/glucanase superfamily protein n=1 Tax=Actinocrispum wychmicini TaxID=1213861 RepID=A0A4R2JYY2_9PSEU|nr:PQQ-dependent sugar dehydrogenase [Actinocrispum wychmicini]TCO62658.1 concanavalin A-like lectin/glucanase superfamily protein [Actinocrispum wychmicini]